MLTDPLEVVQKTNADLEEYKLATQVQLGYYDLAYKSITIFLTITGLSLGFALRDSISDRLKIIFCWFNLAMSLLAVIGFWGFRKMSERIARRMDHLGNNLNFELGYHHALGLGILFTWIGAVGVFLFWIAAIVFRLWAK